MNVNVKASFALTQLLYPTMKARGGGAVVYISSTAGSYAGKYKDYFGYSLSKASLDNLAKFVSPELGEANITVNSVIAGLFHTEFAKGVRIYIQGFTIGLIQSYLNCTVYMHNACKLYEI